MSLWKQWVNRPQDIWLRKALFQVHLWSGIALGLYIIVVCVSGSVAVFNSELYTVFYPETKIVTVAGPRMSRDDIKTAAERDHPGLKVTRIAITRDPRYAATVTFGTSTYAPQRFIDPYTGVDVGNARPFGLRMVSFFSQLHMDLLMEYRGRKINGVGGLLVTLMSLTGIVIWWPGIRRWRDSLNFRRDANFARFNWSLHSAIGFWTFAIALMWSITGTYLVFPRPFDSAIEFALRRPISLGQLPHSIHVGNFAGWPVKALWAILGLVPPVLFVTGFIMWWNRVLSPWRKRESASPSLERLPRTSAPVFEADGISPVAASRSGNS